MTKTLEILLKHLGGPATWLYVVKTPLDEIAREIDQANTEKERNLREDMLLQMGHFMWILGEDEQDQEERSLLIGYDESGMPDEICLDIFGRTHAQFRYAPKPEKS